MIFGKSKPQRTILTYNFWRLNLGEQTSVRRDSSSPAPPGERNPPTLAPSAARKVKKVETDYSSSNSQLISQHVGGREI